MMASNSTLFHKKKHATCTYKQYFIVNVILLLRSISYISYGAGNPQHSGPVRSILIYCGRETKTCSNIYNEKRHEQLQAQVLFKKEKPKGI